MRKTTGVSVWFLATCAAISSGKGKVDVLAVAGRQAAIGDDRGPRGYGRVIKVLGRIRGRQPQVDGETVPVARPDAVFLHLRIFSSRRRRRSRGFHLSPADRTSPGWPRRSRRLTRNPFRRALCRIFRVYARRIRERSLESLSRLRGSIDGVFLMESCLSGLWRPRWLCRLCRLCRPCRPMRCTRTCCEKEPTEYTAGVEHCQDQTRTAASLSSRRHRPAGADRRAQSCKRRPRFQFISMPPSTLIAWPVISVFSSEATKTAAAAISSGSETRLRGIFSTSRALAVPGS